MNKWKLNNKEKQETHTHRLFLLFIFTFFCVCMFVFCVFFCFFCFLVTVHIRREPQSIQMHCTRLTMLHGWSQSPWSLTKSRHFLFEPQVDMLDWIREQRSCCVGWVWVPKIGPLGVDACRPPLTECLIISAGLFWVDVGVMNHYPNNKWSTKLPGCKTKVEHTLPGDPHACHSVCWIRAQQSCWVGWVWVPKTGLSPPFQFCKIISAGLLWRDECLPPSYE